ncbi:hypothetical protein DUNSADRAFT_13278, partial [Dunaliella salina]
MHCLHSGCTRHAASPFSGGIATTLPPSAVVLTPTPVRTSVLDCKKREGILVRGRRDGNSSHSRKEQQRRRRQRIRMSEDNWWEEDGRLKEDMLQADFLSEVPQRRGRGSKKGDDEEEDGQVGKLTSALFWDMLSKQIHGFQR